MIELIKAQLEVKSSTLRQSQIVEALQQESESGGHDIGSPHPRRPIVARDWSLWLLSLIPDPSLHASTEGISRVVEGLGEPLADRLSVLAARDCRVVISIVQELSPDDSESTGLYLSTQALAWMARAQAELDVDQYVLNGG